jgi:predicted esterase
VFIAHGTEDNIVPPPMAGQLAAVTKAKVAPYMVQGAGHNDVFETGGDALWEAMRAGISGAR